MKSLKKGFIRKDKDFDIVIKFDEANPELIRFIPHKKSFDITVDNLLELILKNFREKELSIALSTTDIDTIPVVNAVRQLNVTLGRDFKEGETLELQYQHTYPYSLAALEEAYKLCLAKGEVKSIPKEVYEDVAKKLVEINRPFVEKFYKKELKQDITDTDVPSVMSDEVNKI